MARGGELCTTWDERQADSKPASSGTLNPQPLKGLCGCLLWQPSDFSRFQYAFWILQAFGRKFLAKGEVNRITLRLLSIGEENVEVCKTSSIYEICKLHPQNTKSWQNYPIQNGLVVVWALSQSFSRCSPRFLVTACLRFKARHILQASCRLHQLFCHFSPVFNLLILVLRSRMVCSIWNFGRMRWKMSR